MANGLHEMGFTDPYSAPDEEGVVGGAGIFDNTLGGSEGKIITIADN